ncbi:hypothetical protein D3C87_75850 [compost metagenome]
MDKLASYIIGIDHSPWVSMRFDEINFEKFYFYPNLREKVEVLITNATMLNWKVNYLRSTQHNRSCIEFTRKSSNVLGIDQINILIISNKKNLPDCVATSGNYVNNKHSNSRRGINRLFNEVDKQLIGLV